MHPIKLRRPSISTVIALVALFVALGGPAQARKLVGAADIKNGAITAKHIKAKSITANRLKPRALSTANLSRRAITALQTTPLNEVDGSKVADKSLQGVDIADAALGQSQLASGSVASEEIVDGGLEGADVGGFIGRSEFDFGELGAGTCKQATAAASPIPGRSRDLSDDVVIVTPDPSLQTDFAGGKGISLFGRAEAPATIGIVLCNHSGAAMIVGRRVFRYISFDVG